MGEVDIAELGHLNLNHVALAGAGPVCAGQVGERVVRGGQELTVETR